MVGALNRYRAPTSYVTASTSGTFSHATQVPVVSVNLSMMRTSRMCPATASAIGKTLVHCAKKGGVAAPFSAEKLLLLRFGLGRACPAAAFGPVVIGRERVRREHEALGRHHHRGVLALRSVHLLEEGALRRLLGRDEVPGLEELGQDLGRGTQHAHAVLLLHLLQRV